MASTEIQAAILRGEGPASARGAATFSAPRARRAIPLLVLSGHLINPIETPASRAKR